MGLVNELRGRVEQLWAAIGYSKMRYLYEDELRALGGSCVTPLASYLSSATDQDAQRRELAARIVADVATSEAASRLIDLLRDSQPEVRYHAARGLARISGRRFGGDPASWKSASPAKRLEWIADWRRWLAETPGFSQPRRFSQKKI